MALWIPRGMTFAGSNTTINSDYPLLIESETPGMNGIFHYLATNGDTEAFSNPVTRGFVTGNVGYSQSIGGPTGVLSNLFVENSGYGFQNTTGNWLSIGITLDFSGIRAQVTKVGLRGTWSVSDLLARIYVTGKAGNAGYGLAEYTVSSNDSSVWNVGTPTFYTAFSKQYFYEGISISWEQRTGSIVTMEDIEIWGRIVPSI